MSKIHCIFARVCTLSHPFLPGGRAARRNVSFFHLTDNQPTGTGNPISTEDAETDWSRVVVTTFTREDWRWTTCLLSKTYRDWYPTADHCSCCGRCRPQIALCSSYGLAWPQLLWWAGQPGMPRFRCASAWGGHIVANWQTSLGSVHVSHFQGYLANYDRGAARCSPGLA